MLNIQSNHIILIWRLLGCELDTTSTSPLVRWTMRSHCAEHEVVAIQHNSNVNKNGNCHPFQDLLPRMYINYTHDRHNDNVI